MKDDQIYIIMNIVIMDDKGKTMTNNNQKTKKKKKPVRRDLTYVNRIMAFFVLVCDVLIVLSMMGLTHFSSLSKSVFVRLNIVMLVVLLIVNLLSVLAVGRRSLTLVKTVLISSLILSVIGGAGLMVESNVRGNLDKIMDQTKRQEQVAASYVVRSSDQLTEVQQLKGKSLGILQDEQSQQGYQMPLKENEQLGLKMEYHQYSDYGQMLKALSEGEIDVASMPKDYRAMFENNEEMTQMLQGFSDIHTFEKKLLMITEDGSDKDVTREPFTVLLIGVDDRRADALILASVNPVSMRVLLTSIPRDSYVPIACYEGNKRDKINNSRSRGRQCTIDTVEALMDVEIDFYVESNFYGIVDIVDALGGVIINNPVEFVGQDASEERGHQTVWVPQGENRLDGLQTLAFARERHSFNSGDFQRQSHQQMVIEAIMTELVTARDINTLMKVMEAAGDNIATNFSMEQMIGFFNLTMKKLDRTYAKNQTLIQMTGSRLSGVLDRAPNRMSIVRLYQGSIEDNRKAIRRMLMQDREYSDQKTIRFSCNWVFDPEPVSKDEYDEKFEILK